MSNEIRESKRKHIYENNSETEVKQRKKKKHKRHKTHDYSDIEVLKTEHRGDTSEVIEIHGSSSEDDDEEEEFQENPEYLRHNSRRRHSHKKHKRQKHDTSERSKHDHRAHKKHLKTSEDESPRSSSKKHKRREKSRSPDDGKRVLVENVRVKKERNDEDRESHSKIRLKKEREQSARGLSPTHEKREGSGSRRNIVKKEERWDDEVGDETRGNDHGPRDREGRGANDRDRRDRGNERRSGRQTSGQYRHRNEDNDNYEWGQRGNAQPSEPVEAVDKQKPDFKLSGKLTEDRNTYNGVVIKYSEPPEARMPKKRWRLYQFKGDESLPTLYIHRQSAYLIGRDRKIADLPVDHPSCSKQHAALQYRLVTFERSNGSIGKQIRLYIIDLESANGTFINGKKIEPKKYVELMEKDVIKFGFSSREYVLLHEHSKDDELSEEN